MLFFFFQAEDGIRDGHVTGVQTCALPILVHCDEPLSGFYQPDADEAEMRAALPVLLCAEPGPGRQKVALHRRSGGAEPGAVSMMAAFLRWWFGSEARLELRTERTTWAWERY